MRFRPRLSAVLMVVNIAVILLPLGSIFFFRIYENQLVQETERELISQAAVIGAAYQATFRYVSAGSGEKPDLAIQAKVGNGKLGSIWSPVSPQLDLARVDTLPARPDGLPPKQPSSALSVGAGRALTPVLKRAQRTTLAGARVLDSLGTVVGGTAEIGLNFAHVDEVAVALTGEYASTLRFRELENAPSQVRTVSTISRGTRVRVFVAYPVVDRSRVLGVIYLSRTPKSVLRHMYEEQDKVILAIFTVLVLSFSLAMLTSRTISRPIAQLLRRTGRVARGETAAMAPLERPGTREMAELSDGITRMATALNDRAAYIRTLANHVSHEFKTPIASIQGAAELLTDHDDTMTPDERRHFLTSISKGGDRLRTLLDRLLELARAENAERTDEVTELAPVLRRATRRLPDTVLAELDVPEGLEAMIAAEALAIVLENLFDNAASHRANRVHVSATIRGDKVELDVADNGEGVSAANRDKIFEHFFTTRRDTGGTGLGLGIVRALLAAHGGDIQLMESERGATFRLRLPLP
ncbi:MAG: HAMP domain-containing sensor histidine kinase [Pseudomonadota bacterium]